MDKIGGDTGADHKDNKLVLPETKPWLKGVQHEGIITADGHSHKWSHNLLKQKMQNGSKQLLKQRNGFCFFDEAVQQHL